MTVMQMPGYSNYDVYVGEFPPAGGCFYSPAYGHNLSKLANRVYGVGTLPFVLQINKSAWNIEHCVYRMNPDNPGSTSCKSPKVDPGEAGIGSMSSWNGPWIALCPGQVNQKIEGVPINPAAAMGLQYPVLWVPAEKGDEPIPDKPKKDLHFDLPDLPSVDVNIEAPDIPEGEFLPPEEEEETLKAGIGGGLPWWLWLLLLGGTVGGGYYLYKRGQKG